MLIRKLGKFLRGNASALQINLACVLGSLLAFIPGFANAPGLYVILFIVVLILNVNLFLLGLSFLLTSLLAFLLVPVTFQMGALLLDGPFQGMIKLLINAPVTAWFGFEYYLTTGGIFLGILFGLILGLIISRLLQKFRKFMAGLEENSTRFKTLSSKFWFRAVTFILFGGLRGKKSFKQIVEEGSRGSFIRPMGVVAALAFALLLVVGSLFLNETILTEVVRSELEKANGATVELDSFQLKPREGRITVEGLAMADAGNLSENIFTADSLMVDIGMARLLSKKFEVDTLLIGRAASGEPRRLPGKPVGPRPREEEPPPDETAKPSPEDETTVEDLLDGLPEWKDRLTRVKTWLDSSSRKEKEIDGEPATTRMSLKEKVRILGYNGVKARHLIAGNPLLTINQLDIEHLTVAQLPDEVLKITGNFISTHPNLLESAPLLDVQSESGDLLFHFSGGGLSASSGANRLDFHYLNLPVETIREAIPDPDKLPVKEGVLDIRTEEATLLGSTLDMTLDLNLRDAVIAINDKNTFDVSELQIPARITGPVNRPRLSVDSSVLQDLLTRQVKSRVKKEVEEKVGKEVEEEVKKLLPGGLDSLFKK